MIKHFVNIINGIIIDNNPAVLPHLLQKYNNYVSKHLLTYADNSVDRNCQICYNTL